MNNRIISISSLVIAITLILVAVFWGSQLSLGIGLIASIFINLAIDVHRISIKLAFIKAITYLVLVVLVILKLVGRINLNPTLFWVLLIVASGVIIYKEISERSTYQD